MNHDKLQELAQTAELSKQNTKDLLETIVGYHTPVYIHRSWNPLFESSEPKTIRICMICDDITNHTDDPDAWLTTDIVYRSKAVKDEYPCQTVALIVEYLEGAR